MRMSINIIAFGKIAEIIGSAPLTFPHVSSTNELKEFLNVKFPELKKVKYAIALNKKLITTDAAIEVSANIALLPPFSGG